MLRRKSPGAPALLISFLLLSLGSGGCGKHSGTTPTGSESTSVESEQDAVEANDGETDPTLMVPNGTPEEMLAFMKKLSQNRPQFRNFQEGKNHTIKVNKAIVRAGNKILSKKNVEDATLKEALSRKFVSTIGLIITGNGVPPEQALEEVNRLKNDPRPAVAAVAKKYSIPVRAVNLKSLSSEEKSQLQDEAVARVVATKASYDAIGDVTFLGEQMSQLGENNAAADLLLRLADTISKSTADQKILGIGQQIRDRSSQVRLPGSELQLEGTLLDGSQLDWASYRGKVVLVDFWATWCAPCVAELPNVQANYVKYHDRGFDVLGISLDRDRKKLEAFLERETVPWKQMYDPEAENNNRWQHPMAVKYSIRQIPAALLVDRNGKVVSVEARGDELNRQLKRLLDSEN